MTEEFEKLQKRVKRLERKFCCNTNLSLVTGNDDVDETLINTIQILTTGEVNIVDSEGNVTTIVESP